MTVDNYRIKPNYWWYGK